jgi:hypothetical protein
MSIYYRIAVAVGMVSLAQRGEAGLQLQLLHNGPANIQNAEIAGDELASGEVVSFDALTKRIFTNRSQTDVAHGVNVFDYTNPTSPFAVGFLDLSGIFGGANQTAAVTSVAVDPLGRGFGAAAIVPRVSTSFNATNSLVGKIALFDTQTNAILNVIDAGYHPDSVSFSPDGSRLLVANEGEYANLAGATQQPGSLGVLGVGGVTASNRASTLGALASNAMNTYDFVGVSGMLASLRPVGSLTTGVGGTETPAQSAEPEFVTVAQGKAYASLQELNAVGVFDLETATWSAVQNLGTINQNIDQTFGDGARTFTKVVRSLPMPDNVVSFVHNGTTFYVTANEGDARADGRDETTVQQLNQAGNPSYEGPATETQLRSLRISRIDGDTDGNGAINEITAFGSRSISIYEGITGNRVYDSGDLIENYIVTNDPGGYIDGRSPQKGPEPEALAVGEVNGQRLLFVGAERTNSILMFDITDPFNPVVLDYDRISDGGEVPVRPESLVFIPASTSPTGLPMLAVGYEGQESVDTERLVLYALVPEPSVTALLGGLIGLAGLRRRPGSGRLSPSLRPIP